MLVSIIKFLVSLLTQDDIEDLVFDLLEPIKEEFLDDYPEADLIPYHIRDEILKEELEALEPDDFDTIY